MKTFIWYLTAVFFRIALWFRYRIRTEGLEKLTPETLNKAGGVLFLPNHQAVFVDPVAITLSLFPKFQLRPMIVEYMYYLPVVNWLMRKMNALAVPNFTTSSNSLKRKKNEAVIQAVVEGLKNKENFLIYPAGKCKLTGVEQIGGASAVPYIINEVPDANIVLVRIKGLWGSSFSKAFTSGTPPFFPTLIRGIKAVFKNLLFFSPRRQIVIEFVPAPANFPYRASRIEMNRWLENWYNQPDGLSLQKGDLPGDSLVMVSSSMWGEAYPEMKKTSAEMSKEEISLEGVSPEVKQKVCGKLGELAEVDPKFIREEMNLASDLGLDSIHLAEFVAFLQETFEIGNISPNELTTVGKSMAIAAKKLVIAEEEEEQEGDTSNWSKAPPKRTVSIPDANSIPEAFLKVCKAMGNTPACVDLRSGVVTYSQMKVRVLLLAEVIRNLPGKNIGILLPSSVGAAIMIFATQLAGKVPVMINWTVGPKHLESVRELSKVETVLTS